MEIRQYHADDEKQLVALWNEVLWADKICLEFFREKLLLEPNIIDDGIFIAEESGKMAGAVIAWTRTTAQPWGFEGVSEEQKDTGFMLPLLIAPEHKNSGLGKELLEKSEKYLIALGKKYFSVCEYNPLFFLNGLDKESYPELHNFYLKNQYRQNRISYSMRIDLHKYVIPEDTRQIEKKLLTENITFSVCKPELFLAARKFLAKEFPRWLNNFIYKVQKIDTSSEIMLALRGAEAVGFCQYNYYGQQERVGPFGVSESLRGKKVGHVMVAKLCERMTEKGFQSAYFSSCVEGVKNFYGRNGFKVYKEKTIFTKEVSA
ncbi:MAG: hypothetical protein A2096_00250 [Spirochaetes bacterium GWF1_41_5]|nr:MAG: hypothetical protein A2096_00250 [Spirochaetes bacterium GWF1_41_5]HBE02955.1 hypothetical protein [Spirochaetia bacterium]